MIVAFPGISMELLTVTELLHHTGDSRLVGANRNADMKHAHAVLYSRISVDNTELLFNGNRLSSGMETAP